MQARGKPTLVRQCHLLSLPAEGAHPQHAVLKVHKINTIMSMLPFTCTTDITSVWQSALNTTRCTYNLLVSFYTDNAYSILS